MANNQITPFQLTDQFTMDNFNQRINETNTALQNNDPRNWGLDLSKSLTDANDGTRNGFYAMTTGAANVPFDYGVLLVHNIGNPNYVHQELTHYSEGIKACRAGAWDDSISAIKWRPWEYVNPPMVIGVEYRTTERYLGKPVYVMVVDCGYLPNAGGKTITYSDDENCRLISVYGAGISIPTLNLGGNLNTTYPSDSVVSIDYGTNKFQISCGGDRSNVKASVFVKYWKTTD